MWSPSDDRPPRALMRDARGRWVSVLEDPLPDLWVDAAPFFAALLSPIAATHEARGDGPEAAAGLSATAVSPWTILKSPDGDRAPPLEFAQHVLVDTEAVRKRALPPVTHEPRQRMTTDSATRPHR